MTSYRNQIPGLLKHYHSETVVSVDNQSNGYANQNYRVRTDCGKYFVRVCLQQSVENVIQEIILMDALKQNNFKTAYPLRREDGEWISFIDDIPIVVYNFIDGDLPNLNNKVVSEIAEATAKLSLLTYPENLIKGNAISLNDSLSLIESEAFKEYSNKDVTDNFESILNSLKDKLVADLPMGIVHGDIFPDNTLFNGDKLAAIIDFEEFSIDKLLFDVGMTINGFCFEENNLDTEHLRCFLSHYNKIRLITKTEKELVVDFIVWGAVGMTSWHLHQLLYRENTKQLERVRVLLERASWVIDNRSGIEQVIKEALKK